MNPHLRCQHVICMWKIVLIILGLLYVLSPLDVVPDALIGWGWLDDLVVIGALVRFFLQLRDGGRSRPRNGRQFQRPYGENASRDNDSGENKKNERSASQIDDPYGILGLEPNASNDEIKQAYRRLANRYHPDKVEHLGSEFRELAEKRFKEIQQAYQQLKGTSDQ